MTVRRVMGTETEYAVSAPAVSYANPVQLSFDVIGAAADPERSRIRWDYRQEDPVNDARGTRLERAAARPDMLTDEPQLNIVNVIAPNGGRMYVDHAHPEYSAPETTDPFEAVRYDHAGDLLMRRAAASASARTGHDIVLHRNNVDGKGASWGTHENYMMLRSVPFDTVAALMTAHFVSRQIYAGSGRVGIGERSETAGYQLSQRADYIHAILGLQTTFERPIVNTRDESHSPSDYRRLHVIVGDANRMDVPQTLKLGATSMLLWLAEHADETGYDLAALLDSMALVDPVSAMHTVSHERQWIWRRWQNSNTGRDRRRSSSWTVCGRCRRWASCWAAKAGMTRPRPFSRHWKMQRVWRKSGGAKQWIELFEKTKTSVDLVVRCVAGTYLRCADLRRGGAQRQDRVHGTELFVLGDSVL